jgi:hypothetical protein
MSANRQAVTGLKQKDLTGFDDYILSSMLRSALVEHVALMDKHISGAEAATLGTEPQNVDSGLVEVSPSHGESANFPDYQDDFVVYHIWGGELRPRTDITHRWC